MNSLLLLEINMKEPLQPTAYVSSFAGYAVVSAYYGVTIHAYEGGPDTSGGKPWGGGTDGAGEGKCRPEDG